MFLYKNNKVAGAICFWRTRERVFMFSSHISFCVFLLDVSYMARRFMCEFLLRITLRKHGRINGSASYTLN